MCYALEKQSSNLGVDTPKFLIELDASLTVGKAFKSSKMFSNLASTPKWIKESGYSTREESGYLMDTK